MTDMLDYVLMANARLRENLARARELVAPAVSAILDADRPSALRIVASGSSRHAALAARHHMQRSLGMPVTVITSEAFCAFEHDFPRDAFNIAISQSGYSTNTLAALDFMRERGMPVIALTGNPAAPIRAHASVVVDYGVGVESVDFVTMGVQSLIEFLMLFGLLASHALGTLSEPDLEHGLSGISNAVDAHAGALDAAEAFASANRLVLARLSPTSFVGNGPNLGVVQEAALKFCETLKHPAMYFEGEEFIHGPQMQIAPGHVTFIIDDPAGSSRLREVFHVIRAVSSDTFLVTSHPDGEGGELAIPLVEDPLACAIPNLAPFQYIAADVTGKLGCWDVHPFLKASSGNLGTKAPGYDEAVKELEARAART